MSEGQEFLKECKEVRDDFTAIAGLYTVDEHLVLRTEIDSLLIMYDQLCERVRVADSSNENSGLHKHFVNNLAKLAEFVKQQKDLPPEINDIVNDNFWDLI